jgi:signal transduction histidine kinase
MAWRRSRVRASRRPTLFTGRDRLLALLIVAAAVGVAIAASVVGRGSTSVDQGAVDTTRIGLATALRAQASPVLSALRRQAVDIARRTAAGTLATDNGAPRLTWVTDARGRVTETSPAASALLGRIRPPVRAGAAGAVGPPGQDPLLADAVADPVLGGGVVVASAPLPGGRAVSLAFPAALVGGLTAPPFSSAGTTAALIAPDGTTALESDGAAGGRQPADPELLAAARAGRAHPSTGALRFTGQGGVPRSGSVRPLGDGWVAVAEGPVPDQSAAQARRTVLHALTWAAAAITLLALLLAARIIRRNSGHADAVQTAVLTVVGHELRTPLTAILTTSQTLARGWGRLKGEQREELVGTITRAARVLDRMVERLLHAGRLAAGEGLEMALRPTAVDAVVQRLLDDLRPSAPLHDLRLEIHPGTPEAIADPRALAQVLGHLIDNAVKFSPGGGQVLVTLSREGRRRPMVRIEVQDEGVGLPSDRSRLFRPFGQSGQVNTRGAEEGGVGVGLSIVKNLVDAMGGSVHAESHDGGSRFVVRLPGSTP